jgi:hypothetical protein
MVSVLLLVGFGLMGTALCGLIWQNSQLRGERSALYERLEFLRHMARCDARRIQELESQNKLQAIRLDSRNS